MDRKEFAAVAALLTAYYPHQIKVSDSAVLEVWYAELADLPGEAVLAAVRHMARSTTEWPSIAQVRRFASPVQDVGQLWADTVKTACEYGPHGKWCSETLTALKPSYTAKQRVGLERIGGVGVILEAKDQQELDRVGRNFQKAVLELRDYAQTQSLLMDRYVIPSVSAPQERVLELTSVISDLGEKMNA